MVLLGEFLYYFFSTIIADWPLIIFRITDRLKFVDTVKKALDIGYRHFDCAWKYGVGQACSLGSKCAK